MALNQPYLPALNGRAVPKDRAPFSFSLAWAVLLF